MIPQPVRDGSCPNCGWTENRLVETGMLGCPLCYEAFSDRVWKQFGIERTESAWATT
jgi:protein-arginine kinase activator protein McsA